MTPTTETKRCPYCAEEILAAAVKCKHCGSDVRGDTGGFRPRLLIGIVPFFLTYALKVIAAYYGDLTNPGRAAWTCLVISVCCIAVLSGLFRRKRWARDWGIWLSFLYAAGGFWDLLMGKDHLGVWGVALFGVTAGLSLLALGADFPKKPASSGPATSPAAPSPVPGPSS